MSIILILYVHLKYVFIYMYALYTHNIGDPK